MRSRSCEDNDEIGTLNQQIHRVLMVRVRVKVKVRVRVRVRVGVWVWVWVRVRVRVRVPQMSKSKQIFKMIHTDSRALTAEFKSIQSFNTFYTFICFMICKNV